MSALLQEKAFHAKIDENFYVLGKVVFERVLEGFREGFGKPKTSIFALFSMIFRSKF